MLPRQPNAEFIQLESRKMFLSILIGTIRDCLLRCWSLFDLENTRIFFSDSGKREWFKRSGRGKFEFRWLTKAFKVWAFAKGTRLTQHYSRQYANKYLLKYLRKEAKAGLKNRMAARWDQQNTIRLAAGISEILEFGYGSASPGPRADARNKIFDLIYMAFTASLDDAKPSLEMKLTASLVIEPSGSQGSQGDTIRESQPVNCNSEIFASLLPVATSPLRFINTRYDDSNMSNFVDRQIQTLSHIHAHKYTHTHTLYLSLLHTQAYTHTLSLFLSHTKHKHTNKR